MSDGFTLFTIQGLPARLLKLGIGTPLVLVGAGFVAVGLGAGETVETLVPMLLGSILGFAGLYYCYGAIRSDEFAVTVSESSGNQDAEA